MKKHRRYIPICHQCECGDHFFANTSRWGVALVSECDSEWLIKYVWTLVTPKPFIAYARSEKLARKIGSAGYLHTAILFAPEMVDHIDGNGLDCRRKNIRPASRAENKVNVKRRTHSRSGFWGVHQNTSGRGPQWKVAIKIDKRQLHLGYFDDPVEAAKAYDLAALKAFKDFATLNFPL